jgi:hypothetical protein
MRAFIWQVWSSFEEDDNKAKVEKILEHSSWNGFMNCETFSQMLLKILEMKILEKACISCQ